MCIRDSSPHCLDAPIDDVAIVFASVPAADVLTAALGEVGTEALCQVNEVLREALDRRGGYEVSGPLNSAGRARRRTD